MVRCTLEITISPLIRGESRWLFLLAVLYHSVASALMYGSAILSPTQTLMPVLDTTSAGQDTEHP